MIDEITKNYSANDLMEEVLVGNDDEERSEPKTTGIRTGIAQTELQKAPPRQEHHRPNATRWAFNPYAVIDLTNKPASCGIRYLPNVVFQKIESFAERRAPVAHNNIAAVAVTSDSGAPLMGDGLSSDGYEKQARTSYMIARELEEHYGDRGVAIIEELTGEDDEQVVSQLNMLLFGDEVKCVEDVNYGPDFPVPVLPTMLETIDANLNANSRDLDPETRTVVTAVANRVRRSIREGVRNCRLKIDVAQRRLLDEKNPNRNLSFDEQRCYLALGEEVPNQLPFVGRSMAAANRGGSVDSEAIGRGIAQGLAAAGVQTNAPQAVGDAPAKQAPTVSVPTASFAESGNDGFSVSESDIEQADAPAETPRSGKKIKTS